MVQASGMWSSAGFLQKKCHMQMEKEKNVCFFLMLRLFFMFIDANLLPVAGQYPPDPDRSVGMEPAESNYRPAG